MSLHFAGIDQHPSMLGRDHRFVSVWGSKRAAFSCEKTVRQIAAQRHIAFPILQPYCPGQRLRLNRRARLSPAFCFVGSSSRILNNPET